MRLHKWWLIRLGDGVKVFHGVLRGMKGFDGFNSWLSLSSFIFMFGFRKTLY